MLQDTSTAVDSAEQAAQLCRLCRHLLSRAHLAFRIQIQLLPPAQPQVHTHAGTRAGTGTPPVSSGSGCLLIWHPHRGSCGKAADQEPVPLTCCPPLLLLLLRAPPAPLWMRHPLHHTPRHSFGSLPPSCEQAGAAGQASWLAPSMQQMPGDCGRRQAAPLCSAPHLGRMWMCTCGTVCPARGPSWMARVREPAPKWGSMALPTRCARHQRSATSTGASSAKRGTTRLGLTSTCPGTTGLRLTKAKQWGEVANTSSPAIFQGPKEYSCCGRRGGRRGAC